MGLPGLFPLPAKFRIWFDDPIDVSVHKDKLEDPDAIRDVVDNVIKKRIQDMLDQHLAELPRFPFF